MRAHRRGPTLLLALALTVAACGADDAETDAALGDEESADDTGTDEPPTTDQAAAGTITIADTDLGEVVVDADGMTLYLFDPDEQGESTCYDECASNWPPLVDDDPSAGDGVDGALLGTTTREGGETQVTYDGWPLYHWVGDEEPGDVTGQGVEDVWWVLDPSGQPLRDAAGGDDDADAGGTSGY